MQAFKTLTGVAAPLDIMNVDTDMIIPKQYLKTIKRTGLGTGLFSEMRYKEDGSDNPDFVLNKPAYRKAEILVAGDNFGCGSSREHAVWVMADWGYRAVLARSFAPIFRQNALSNGLVPIVISAEILSFFEENRNSILNVGIDLLSLSVTVFDSNSICLKTFSFKLDAFDVHCLRHGLDTLSFLRSHSMAIDAFVSKNRSQFHSLNVFNSGGHAP